MNNFQKTIKFSAAYTYKVAILGASSAGLAIAYYLDQSGVEALGATLMKAPHRNTKSISPILISEAA